MKRILLSLSLLLTFCTAPAFAAQPLTVKPDSVSVEFKAVGRPSFLKIVGKSAKLDSKLEHNDKGGLAGSFDFDLDSLDTGIGLRDKHMKEKYLETGRFPKAHLEVTEALVPGAFFTQEKADQDVTVKGSLTLHGVTKPVEVTSHLTRQGKGFESQTELKLKLTDYGIEIPKYAGITIAEDVEVKIHFAAE